MDRLPFNRIVRWFSQTLSANRQVKPQGSELASRRRWMQHGTGGVTHEGREAWERREVRPNNTPGTLKLIQLTK